MDLVTAIACRLEMESSIRVVGADGAGGNDGSQGLQPGLDGRKERAKARNYFNLREERAKAGNYFKLQRGDGRPAESTTQTNNKGVTPNDRQAS